MSQEDRVDDISLDIEQVDDVDDVDENDNVAPDSAENGPQKKKPWMKLKDKVRIKQNDQVGNAARNTEGTMSAWSSADDIGDNGDNSVRENKKIIQKDNFLSFIGDW